MSRDPAEGRGTPHPGRKSAAGRGASSRDLEARLRETAALLAVARVASSPTEVSEALRLICRELSRLTGAETVAAYVRKADGAELDPMAAYRVPKHALHTLTTTGLSPADQRGFDAVLRGGQIIWSDDLPSDPRFAIDLFHRFPHQSGLVIPLFIDEQVAGAFYLVWWKTRRRFMDEELAPLRAIGEQAGVLLQNVRLHEALSARASGLRTLTRLNQRVSSSLEPDEVLAGIAAAAAELMAVPIASVWVADPAAKRLEARASAGGVGELPSRSLALGEGDVGTVASERRPLEIVDIRADDRVTNPEWWLAGGVVSVLGVPILFQDTLLGVLMLGGRAPLRLGSDDRERLDIFVAQSAGAIARARLFQDTQDRRRLTEDLYALTQAMDRSMDLQERVDIFVAAARQALNFERINVWLGEDDGAALKLLAGSDAHPDVPRRIPLASSGGFKTVWESGITLMVLSDDHLARIPALPPELRTHPILRTRRFALVPLLFRGRPIGVVSADNKPSRRPVTRRGVAHLELFCQQLATSIENSRLYSVTQQNLAGAALLNAAARTLHRTLDVRRLLPEAAGTLAQTFGARRAGLVLFEERGGTGAVIPWGEWRPESVRALAEPLSRREAPLLISDTGSRPDLVAAGLLEPGQSLAGFPVRGRSRVLGGLLLLFATPRSLTEAETRLLAAYADQLAMALDNASLFEEAENQKTRLEQVFASTSDGFLVLDLERRVVALNERGGELLGVDPGRVTGRPFQQLVEALESAVAWEDAGGQALAEALGRAHEPADGDLEVRLPERRTLRWLCTPTRDLLGAIVGVTITIRDVTREREIDRMKTEFVSTVSHELRTPLASIKGSLHLLLSDGNLVLDQTQRRLVDISLTNTDRLIRLINNILDVSKMEAGQIHLDLDLHRPADFVEMAVDGIRGFAESRGIAIRAQIAPDLPSLRVDFDRMVQVVTNLLSNAIKFSPERGEVTVGARRAGADVEIWVSDRGPGIAPEDVGRLFRKFQQLDGSTVRAVGGTGLGLAICRGIVEEHGGRIGVESQPSAGATFTVRLPVPGEARVDAEAGEPGAPEEAPLVLVVDDEPGVRAVLRDQLELAGFRVLEAGRVLEGVELAREWQPDVITMDLMLPDLDGFEAIRLLRGQPETRDTPVVVLSAIEIAPGDPRALGATVCLTKPFAAGDLLKAIRDHVRPRHRSDP
jgi:PAS domain S-box-containing protein